MTDVVVAIDQGTTNTKAVAVDPTGAVLARASAPVGVRHGDHGHVEQDPAQIWRTVQQVVVDCLAGTPDLHPVGVALSTQRESVVAWDRRDGRPLGPVLSWQDVRTADDCRRLLDDPRAALVPARTGLPLDPMFSAPKLHRLLADAAEAGSDVTHAAVGTIDSWLLWNLTGGAEHVVEAGNASRTLLLDLDLGRSASPSPSSDRLGWDAELADLFAVPQAALPRIAASTGPFGTVAGDGPLRGLPVLAVLADSHAALLGHGATGPGTVKATYGTGSSVMRPWATPDAVRTGVSTTLAWLTDRPTYALEGNIRYSGAALDWAASLLGLTGGAALGELAATVPDAGGVTLVPAFGGLGAPHWDADAVGLLTGLTGGTTPAHVARAAFEAVAWQVADVVAAMSPDGAPSPDLLVADGGASASALLMQLQADALGCEVVTSRHPELSALGVAGLAGQALGWDPALRADPHAGGTRYAPSIGSDERAARRARWDAALHRSRGPQADRDPSTSRTS
ncbi:FGGY family carbohydrate kinase [Cellulomonas soli]|uniref:ATP:glycerol 3-phosphotransferase n=1 Tax=Cellulomonas soli TaxID=931535 RepID=A0A512P8J2_9CELL|nr:FGGY family carbohydrate kinase [Cellulomonas soli]NYI57674.1 glycerol kinase [Cellulomonas soli]GEP67452.1 glycerol kinase [Cellulomonas soli]